MNAATDYPDYVPSARNLSAARVYLRILTNLQPELAIALKGTTIEKDVDANLVLCRLSPGHQRAMKRNPQSDLRQALRLLAEYQAEGHQRRKRASQITAQPIDDSHKAA